jgi:outer membrane protein assembly factor BamB
MKRLASCLLVLTILFLCAWIDRGDSGRSGTFTDTVSPPFYDSENTIISQILKPIGQNTSISIDLNPAISDDLMIIASKEGRIFALSAKDLTEKWHQDLVLLNTYASFTASPCIDNGKIYIPYYWISPDQSSSSKSFSGICCFNLTDGKLEWRSSDIKNLIESSPLIDGNRIVFGSSDRQVHVLDKTKNGASDKTWTPRPLSGQVKAGIAKLSDGRYIAACQGQPHSDNDYVKNLYCLNGDGSISWGPLETKGSIDYTPACWGNYIFVSTYGYIQGSSTDINSMLYCFDKDKFPDSLWGQQFIGKITGSPATNGKYVVAADTAEQIRIFDMSGNQQAQYRTEGAIQCSPVISDHFVYVGTSSGYLTVYNLETEIINSEEQTPSDIQKLNVGANQAYLKASPAIWDNCLYAVNNIGHVFKFEMMPSVTVAFDKPDQTVKKGEPFSFVATIKNERLVKLKKPLKVSLRTDAEWLSSNSNISTTIQDAGQSSIVEFSGIANSSSSKARHEAEIIIETNDPYITIPPLKIYLTIADKNIQGKDDGKNEIIWDDELERTFLVKNIGNMQAIFDVITDIGISLRSRTFTLNPGDEKVVEFIINPKTIGYNSQKIIKFYFRSDGEDIGNFIINTTIKRSQKVIKLAIGKPTAMIDDAQINLTPAPFITKGVTFVPLRFISEGLGLPSPSWEAEIKTIVIDLGSDKYLRLIIGSSKAYLDQPDGSIMEIKLQAPAQIVSGRTCVPLRLISEQFGCKVDWNASNKEITLTKRLKP